MRPNAAVPSVLAIVVLSIATSCAERSRPAAASPPPASVITAPAATPPPQTPALPKFGDYVFVTELPEAIERIAPSYPVEARRANVSGTVMVQALVDDQGRVVDTRIFKSIPLLDAAAAEAVRQWRFKPARNEQGPVSVWVGVPVTFSLH